MAIVTDSQGRTWDLGDKHVCDGCPGVKDSCEFAHEPDPENGLCPADMAEEHEAALR